MITQELIERLLRVDKTPLFCAQGECGFTEGKHIPTRAELEELVAVGVAEGAEQMKAEIRKTGEFIKTDESMSGIEGDWASLDEHRGEIEGMSARCDLFIVKASVLAPKEKP